MDRIVSQLLAEIDASQGGAGDMFIMGETMRPCAAHAHAHAQPIHNLGMGDLRRGGLSTHAALPAASSPHAPMRPCLNPPMCPCAHAHAHAAHEWFMYIRVHSTHVLMPRALIPP